MTTENTRRDPEDRGTTGALLKVYQRSEGVSDGLLPGVAITATRILKRNGTHERRRSDLLRSVCGPLRRHRSPASNRLLDVKSGRELGLLAGLLESSIDA
jgi:hypothetical protein